MYVCMYVCMYYVYFYIQGSFQSAPSYQVALSLVVLYQGKAFVVCPYMLQPNITRILTEDQTWGAGPFLGPRDAPAVHPRAAPAASGHLNVNHNFACFVQRRRAHEGVLAVVRAGSLCSFFIG